MKPMRGGAGAARRDDFPEVAGSSPAPAPDFYVSVRPWDQAPNGFLTVKAFLAIVAAVLLMGAGAFAAVSVRACWDEVTNGDNPDVPGSYSPEDLDEPLVELSGRGVGKRITTPEIQPIAEGVVERPAAKTEIEEFAVAVMEQDSPPIYPPGAVKYDHGRLDLEVPRSDLMMHRRSFDCGDECEAAWGGKNPPRSFRTRSFFKWDWMGPVLKCGAVAGASYGIAKGVEHFGREDDDPNTLEDESANDDLPLPPSAIGGIGGATCAVLEWTF